MERKEKLASAPGTKSQVSFHQTYILAISPS